MGGAIAMSFGNKIFACGPRAGDLARQLAS